MIRRYYQMIPIDPGFRILNEHEAEMMRQELLEELLEEKYGEAGADGEDSIFVQLADWFSGERSDDAVHALIQRLHDYARSHPCLRNGSVILQLISHCQTPKVWVERHGC